MADPQANPRKGGLAPLPTGIFRPTAQGDDAPVEGTQGTDDQEQGRGDAATKRTRKPRRAPAGGETKGRKLSLPDDVYDRLQLVAIQKRTTVSAVATEVLNKNLPMLRIERD